ncbi:transposase [Xenorhabdus bovienii str. puntauvense]|uniref:Transposase n=1 Tax=Xenorhabdus bovienii str. puntauvense TaxID=1398201 RepID=A0A077N671_XENBV|nr:IS4 family transposase [Xenorhabdus bovienii]CDG97726.1 transposase [Xenorhabdus bovienii str. puntauvense]
MNIYQRLNKTFLNSCSKIDKSWQKRKRTIDTKLIILFLMKIISGKNNHGYAYIFNEIWDDCIREKIPLPQYNPVSASSMCEARIKLPDDAIKTINKDIVSVWEKDSRPITWKGHRLFAIDGSKLNVPRKLINNGYRVTQKTSRYYPYAMMSCLYDISNSIIYDIDFVNHNNERACAEKHFRYLDNDAVVILDRGYFSYYMLHQVIKNNLNAIFRIQEGNRNKVIRDFSNSHCDDAIVTYKPSDAVKSDLRKRKLLFEFPTITLRLIKYFHEDVKYILATTLLEQDYYEVKDFNDLYHQRWKIEELYKLSKSILCIEDFHSHNEKGVKQELQAHILLLNLTRISENYFNHRNGDDVRDRVDNKESLGKKQKLNSKNCLFFIVKHLPLLIQGKLKKHLKSFYYTLYVLMARMIQRVRPERHYPRKSMKPRTRWNSFDAPIRI